MPADPVPLITPHTIDRGALGIAKESSGGKYFAHTDPTSREDCSKWEPLFTPGCPALLGGSCEACEGLDRFHGHLNKVAWWTANFAEGMFPVGTAEVKAAREWGYLAGLWHDLGKFAPQWQDYLRKKSGSNIHTDEVIGTVDHSTAGAQFAERSIPKFGRLLAYLIAGHHPGLTNGEDGDAPQSSLRERLSKTVAEYTGTLPKEVRAFRSTNAIPSFALRSGQSLSFFLRFLFSCLTDADFLATEAFMNPAQASRRPSEQPSIGVMETALDHHLDNLSARADETPVNRRRAEILAACRDAAARPPGMFSLTVPTGGGKTLSSLAFALKHARLHDLRRVIYVIPFTSIIEQNATVFREALAGLGPDLVIENHSNLDPDDSIRCTTRSRLSAENWDARLIVTTNVQFFESLHANKTSRSRKLHRLARAVIILDEAQTLPLDLLQPCLRSLEELTSHYGASVVLCTATQPSLGRRDDFKIGLAPPSEIISDPGSLYQSLRRVRTENLGPQNDDALVTRLREHEQTLCIVSTRRHAREVFQRLDKDESHFHLSALMCPEHRTAVLERIKVRLDEKQPIRVVSTQLIEAGVDIDFPVVFRSLAGLDSIAQAAGRCDREGRLTSVSGQPAGQLYIFTPERPAPAGFLRQAAQSAAEVLATKPFDPLDPSAVEAYFRTHFWKHQDVTDAHHILECWPEKMTRLDDLFLFHFKRCAENFRLIDDQSGSVIVPYEEKGRALCDAVRETFDPAQLRQLARRLQRYSVNIPRPIYDRFLAVGIIRLVHDGFPMLNSDVHYGDELGLDIDDNPGDQIV
ncbi:MAG: CRISPR-associated endonuclease Cas3'' [Chthoniobacterales bacterium]|nr:CRISPR-associated endonuclease Cas3'' [Chthoniobacterales bacterium]